MTPWLDDGDVRLYHGDNIDVLRTLPDKSVHMCATSPPFYGLRDYGTGEWEGGDPDCDHDPVAKHIYGCKGCGAHMNDNNPDCAHCADRHLKRSIHGTSERDISERDVTRPDLPNPPAGWSTRDATTRTLSAVCAKCGARRVDQQIGLEETPDQWVERLVAVFREVRRVLRDDGTLWVEIGDSYAASMTSDRRMFQPTGQDGRPATTRESVATGQRTAVNGLKPKDLLGQPWLLAFALRADGWWLRSEIIWARPNPMPESVTDRPTKSHSTVFLFSKQPRYFYDADAIREPSIGREVFGNSGPKVPQNGDRNDGTRRDMTPNQGANARSVWTIPTQPTPFAHFATWPEQLVRRMILAGTSERGCCPECGSSWVRDVEDLTPRTWSDGREGHVNNPNSMERKAQGQSKFTYGATSVRNTLGWSPSCDCCECGHGLSESHRTPGAECHQCDNCNTHRTPTPVSCTVLDPFAGSATTNLVARNHGRHSIGIELNEDYLKIAAKRLQQLSLLA